MRIRRALLFMPGDSRRKIEKGAGLGVDSIIMDLEDAIALTNKEIARASVAQALREVDFGRSEKLVRTEVALKPGDVLDLQKLSSSRRNLYDTGAFSLVDISRVEVQPESEASSTDKLYQLKVNVREVQPFQVRYGAYYDTERGPGGIVAGFVAFPSAWSLREKIGHPMDVVHAHVPGFSGGTRNAAMISRIFDNLQPGLPAMRMNWSIYPEGDLFWPPERNAEANRRPFAAANNFLRVERQVLRRLPATGDIVFSIRIYSDPIANLLGLPNGPEVAKALIHRLEGFTPEQLDYKGMAGKKAALIAYLSGLFTQRAADLAAS